MSLFDIIAEEWQKLSWVGRVVWFPVFVPVLLVGCAFILIAIPPAMLLEKTIGRWVECLCSKAKRLIYKES